jgi:hypothetical protein
MCNVSVVTAAAAVVVVVVVVIVVFRCFKLSAKEKHKRDLNLFFLQILTY